MCWAVWPHEGSRDMTLRFGAVKIPPSIRPRSPQSCLTPRPGTPRPGKPGHDPPACAPSSTAMLVVRPCWRPLAVPQLRGGAARLSHQLKRVPSSVLSASSRHPQGILLPSRPPACSCWLLYCVHSHMHPVRCRGTVKSIHPAPSRPGLATSLQLWWPAPCRAPVMLAAPRSPIKPKP